MMVQSPFHVSLIPRRARSHLVWSKLSDVSVWSAPNSWTLVRQRDGGVGPDQTEPWFGLFLVWKPSDFRANYRKFWREALWDSERGKTKQQHKMSGGSTRGEDESKSLIDTEKTHNNPAPFNYFLRGWERRSDNTPTSDTRLSTNQSTVSTGAARRWWWQEVSTVCHVSFFAALELLHYESKTNWITCT